MVTPRPINGGRHTPNLILSFHSPDVHRRASNYCHMINQGGIRSLYQGCAVNILNRNGLSNKTKQPVGRTTSFKSSTTSGCCHQHAALPATESAPSKPSTDCCCFLAASLPEAFVLRTEGSSCWIRARRPRGPAISDQMCSKAQRKASSSPLIAKPARRATVCLDNSWRRYDKKFALLILIK